MTLGNYGHKMWFGSRFVTGAYSRMASKNLTYKEKKWIKEHFEAYSKPYWKGEH